MPPTVLRCLKKRQNKPTKKRAERTIYSELLITIKYKL